MSLYVPNHEYFSILHGISNYFSTRYKISGQIRIVHQSQHFLLRNMILLLQTHIYIQIQFVTGSQYPKIWQLLFSNTTRKSTQYKSLHTVHSHKRRPHLWRRRVPSATSSLTTSAGTRVSLRTPRRRTTSSGPGGSLLGALLKYHLTIANIFFIYNRVTGDHIS